jgi:activator of Hsp90 ATPase-like protein
MGLFRYFTDPDGHLWEIMWKPALVGDATQVNRKHGVAPEVGAISFMRVLPGPIERVWAYLTEPEKREKWFASGPMEFRASGRVRCFSVPPEPASTRHHSRSSYGLGDPLTTVKQKCTLLYENQIKTDNTLCGRAD